MDIIRFGVMGGTRLGAGAGGLAGWMAYGLEFAGL